MLGAVWLSRVQCGIVRVHCGLVGSALACCKARPSSNLSSAPHGGSAHAEPTAVKIWRWASANVYK
jgi:hypothetical protein